MIYKNDMLPILKEIKKIMIDEDIEQKDIAATTGLNKGTISNFLNGKSKNATLDSLKVYADAIGYDIDIRFVKKV